MDDMKQLIEKYKRELIEYSKSAAAPPKERLEFPEMTYTEPEPAAEQELYEPAVSEEPLPADSEEPEQPSEQPQIIGYSDSGDINARFNEMMAQLYGEGQHHSEETVEGVSTVTPETAERLDDVPQSGTDEDEQLGRRDFSEDEPLTNSPEDIAPLEQSGEAADIPTEQSYGSVEEYNEMNNRSGMLRFRVYTARGALPVEGASVVITKLINGENHTFYSLQTDISGLTETINLPAPPKELSETPDSTVQPYAVYNADITAEGYNSVAIRDLPVFEGVLSLQRVPLVPDVGQETEVIVEREPALGGGV